MRKPDNNGLEPAQADKLHSAVREINSVLEISVRSEGKITYKLPDDIAGNSVIVDFLTAYFTHALLKTTIHPRGDYLLIERIG